jgi:glycerol-3-phosphate acyltransferase PlsY
MEALYSTLLAVAAFCLGACPFSVWIGWRFLGKDIRDYGDGNPGGANVFRAGGRKSFCLALILDIAKGVPFVVLAYKFLGLPEAAVMVVAVSAISGHAFSPLLRFKGGKAIGVTFGVLFALPQHEMLLAFAVFLFLGFLFIDSDAWTVILGTAGSLTYLVITGDSTWEWVFMLWVLIIFVVKHTSELQTVPRIRVKPVYWFQSRRHI